MLIFVVFLVFVNILMIKTENDVIKVIIKQGTNGSCIIRPIDLTDGTKFTLEVRSDYVIQTGKWEHNGVIDYLEEMRNSTISVNYKKIIRTREIKTLSYTYSHTRVVDVNKTEGNWTFTIQYLKVVDPWMIYDCTTINSGSCTCSASIKVKGSKTKYGNEGKPRAQGPPGGGGVDPGDQRWKWFIVIVALFGLLVFVQSSYIIYGKVKSRRANKNNDEDPISPKSPKGKRSKPKTNIADRPPLPLPPDEVIQTPPQPPVSPRSGHKHHTPPSRPPLSPGPVHKHLYFKESIEFPTAPPMPVEIPSKSHPVPLVSKPSYRNKAMDSSDEGVTSPVFDRRQQGPAIPKHSYRNKALVTSVEELRTPGSSRRYMDGPLVPKQSYRNKALVASVEELRTPDCQRRYMDGPVVSKQSYNNTISDDSDEEHRAPGFARRQIEAKFAQLPPLTPSKSFKLPKPLPRAPPSPTLEKAPSFNAAHRPDPVPPLHPKKIPVFPPPAPFKKQDPSRMSDDEWQYEQLQPVSKYLNNFPTTNNYNNM